ncbi:histone-lysine N-methyltransferase mll5 [Plakobranchus ocellatus]|uniref:Histone-lysine N-methyltransferase mll5 n=1 Tax=Plakobranchus ocellatus TaxID=259542 RepID=A0AAV4DJC9_9GAST|nr:histone-lysine N-methyltransferase mll5 [Plakobranchus ocellatus]
MSVILRVGAVKPIENHEVHYGSGDEASSSYTDADVLDIPLPEHTYQRPLPPTSTASQSSTGYIGLPYQDHNYGMPPPPSPPRPASPRPPSPFEDNGMVQIEEEVKTTPLVSVVEEVVEDSVTRCICGYLHDDGYMICCDKCSYFCELCQPRVLDAVKAKAMQKRKREELAARNVLSDSSATDTDPEEAANALASMGKKLPAGKKKSLKQKRTKAKEKPPLKLKIRKALAQKVKKPGKKEKENITSPKPQKKLMKSSSQKGKNEKGKNRTPLTLEQVTGDPWNSNFSPWVDSYDYAHENQYSSPVRDFSSNSSLTSHTVDISIMPDQLLAHLTCVAEVRKNRKGLRALQEIPAGQAIIEYKGKVMLRHDYDKEHAFVNCFKKLQPFVLFYSQLEVDLCVDARTYGNEARFVRRSCTPNAEVKHILSQGKLYFVILSKKDIMCGFEITIPFDYNYQDCSYCVECACKKNNCVVSRYWKKLKNSQRTPQKEQHGVKRKRQSSGNESINTPSIEKAGLSSPYGSPGKNTSPVKMIPAPSPPKLASPVKLSNVSTLLAASALLDGKLDLSSRLDFEANEPIQGIPPTSQPKSATASRRSSKVTEDIVKEEKVVVNLLTPSKEKAVKTKDSGKAKGKDKESKVNAHHSNEVKKERRSSSRRQSQDDIDDLTDTKADSSSTAHSSGTELDEANGATPEVQKKMTREERKLDAIMKVFEKMEKREERRKEAMARGDQGSKRSSIDSKTQKKEDGSSTHSRSNSQDGPSDNGISVKEELAVNDVTDKEKSLEQKSEGSKTTGIHQKLPLTVEVKSEKTEDQYLKTTGWSEGTSPGIPSSTSLLTHDSRLGSLDSSSKTNRKPGKRKRRRSRVYSTTAMSDVASVSAEEGNSNSSFPPAPLSMPVTPASTPLPAEDADAGIFKYVKTKKHLFDEWSHKHEDETKQEMFVECLPNPHANTMDHLQRRNSQSLPSGHRVPEPSGGSAKKRWLRQAMHEVPAPIAFNHSLSVSTDSGSASPVHGSSSPNPGTCLGSPGAGSPLDFVTPLKKRRLIRESLSNEGTTSPSAGVLAETFSTNGVGISTKTNGVKHMFPATRHSTDDRMFLHKGYPHKNGFSEVVLFTEANGSNTSNSVTNVTSLGHLGAERQGSRVEQINSDVAWRADSRINGVAEGVHMSGNSMPQPTSSSSSYPLKFRGLLERIAVDHSSEMLPQQEAMPVTSSSRNLQTSAVLSNPILTSSSSSPPPPKRKEGIELDCSVSMPPVVVVNSSVYNDVNSLIDTEGSGTGVTAKSIMNEDSPATVRIDLNAHEMEPPTSLSDTSSNVVVNLDDSLFNVGLQGERPPDMAECPVNSSEDVEIFPSARGHGRVSVTICDNACTNSSSRDHTGGPLGVQSLSVEHQQFDSANLVDSSHADLSACDEHKNSEAVSAGCVGDDSNSRDVAGPSSTVSQPYEANFQFIPGGDSNDGISSSGQVCLPPVDRVVVELNSVCDSVNNATVAERNSGWTQDRPCTSRTASQKEVGRGQRDVEKEETRADSNADCRCDSAGNGQDYTSGSLSRMSQENDKMDIEMADSNTAESSSTVELRSPIAISVNSLDSNVDSTSSEAKQLAEATSEYQTPQESHCDSNSDLNAISRKGQKNSVSSDDSCSEFMGVSSSEACASSQRNENQYQERAEEKEIQQGACDNEDLSNNEVSTAASKTCQTTAQEEGAVHEQQENQQLEESSNLSTSVSESRNASHHSQAPFLSSPSPSSSSSVFLSSTSVASTVPDNSCDSRSPSSSGIHISPTAAGCTSNSQAVPSISPISSSVESTPVVKKKVSLLEYRKRLKEKPASSPEGKTSSSSSSTTAISSPLTVTTHKLSSTLSRFLSGSSPTSFSSSLSSSSSSLSPTKASSLSRSSNHDAKKTRMPTLATLPLFKSSDPRKDDKKKPKPKAEKHLSLDDRLRLEFGVEGVEDSSRKKKNGAKPPRWKSASPPPPPPPLHPPYPLSILSSDLSMPHHFPSLRCSAAEDNDVMSSKGLADNSIPPPPPPPLTTSFPVSTSGGIHFGPTSTVRPSQGSFVGPSSQLLNGTRSSHVFQQQPQQQHSTISSTSLNVPPPIGVTPRHPHTGHTVIDQQQASQPPPPSVHGFLAPPYKPLFHLNIHQSQQSASSASSSSASAQRQIHNSALPHSPSWGAGSGQGSSTSYLSIIPQPSVASSRMQHLSQPQQHPRPTPGQMHSKTVVSGNLAQDDHPPPPPPPPPPRPHHHHLSSTSSSSSHRFHNHQGLVGKSKSNKAAASSSSHSSSSSSCFSDNRSRY